jgi:protoporphyrinogen oxidase
VPAVHGSERGVPKTVGVVGGGALGLTAALRLARAGRQVTLLEREQHLGGLATGFRVGDAYLEKFYHHLFGTDRAMIALIDELGLSGRMLWERPPTSILHRGHVYRLDGPREVLRFSPLPVPDRLRLGAALAYLKALPDPRSLEGTTAAAWLRRWMGPRVYGVVWEPLLRGKFAHRAEEIAMPWFWARIHFRTPRLGYLRGGFQLLYEALGEELRRLGTAIHLGAEVRQICRRDGGGARLEVADRGMLEFDQLLVTLPTRLFQRLAPELPPEYGADPPEHFGAHCVVLALDRPLQQAYWLNVNDPGYPFLALVEHTNFLPAADYGGRHLVYLGNYLPMDHPLFAQADAQVLAGFLPALARINPAFDPSWVRESWVFKAPFAQPVVTVGYPRRLPPHQTPLEGVYLANMAHVYPQDRGQNYSVLLGEKLAMRLLADSR